MKVLNVEIVLNNESSLSKTGIISLVKRYLENSNVRGNTVLTQFDSNLHPVLNTEVKAIIIEDTNFSDFINFTCYEPKWHIYTLDLNPPSQQIEERDDGTLNLATHVVLPSASLFNLWENLYYDSNVKENLLRYAQTMLEFSDHGVDQNVVTCNRVILLHGPPGTGKTSLCKALAHKLAIRMQERYSSGILIEINSHSLFSKWFSESGKLVARMFQTIAEIVENPNLLVCVLIDEIESLAHARNQCMSGNEPSDSIRVVNAVLTQIDQIKRHSNVLILTTSNITQSIDLAFIDRADIKEYIGLPTKKAIYQVYHSAIQELMRAHVIVDENIVDLPSVAAHSACDNKYTKKLLEVCEKSQGFSGRSLRKIPFIAHALFLDESFVELDMFLDAMMAAVDREKKERRHFENLPTQNN